MSSEEGSSEVENIPPAPSDEEIQKVQDLIENCITRYMNKDEVIDLLYQENDIEPAFTQTVWEKLEEDNPEFFKAYVLRLALKDQINRFNDLLARQQALVNDLHTRSSQLLRQLAHDDISPAYSTTPDSTNSTESTQRFEDKSTANNGGNSN